MYKRFARFLSLPPCGILRNDKSIKYIISLILLTGIYFFSAQSTFAAFLKFDKTTVSSQATQTFTVDVTVDAGTDQITSTDIWVVYDPAYLEAQTVTNGTFFPAVTSNITSGKVSITGLIVDPGTYKTGTGVVATVTFKSLLNGTSSISFDCRTDVSNSSKIIKNDVNATNLIECSKNTGATVTIGGTATSSTASTGIYATPTVSSVQPTVAGTLPESGIVENIVRFAVPGMVLLMIGVMLRFAL
ncbi:MAG: cohesin domain-containing protein [Patescibacteria group bacterium]